MGQIFYKRNRKTNIDIDETSHLHYIISFEQIKMRDWLAMWKSNKGYFVFGFQMTFYHNRTKCFFCGDRTPSQITLISVCCSYFLVIQGYRALLIHRFRKCRYALRFVLVPCIFRKFHIHTFYLTSLQLAAVFKKLKVPHHTVDYTPLWMSINLLLVLFYHGER